MADEYEAFESANDTGDPVKPPTPPAEDAAQDAQPPEQEEKVKTEDAAKRWQSKADSETARANKLQEELDQLRRTESVGESQTAPPAPSNGSEDPWVAASKDNFRDDLYGSDRRLKVLGFEPNLIQGTTPAEMRQSFASLQGTVDRMESGIRNQVLVEHGLQPVPGAGERATGVNFRTMPTDEFNKVVDKALQG